MKPSNFHAHPHLNIKDFGKMTLRPLLLLLALHGLANNPSKAFSAQSKFIGGQSRSALLPTTIIARNDNAAATGMQLIMRDASAAYWFRVGDLVKVTEDVFVKAGTMNLRGFCGNVVETWEKCDVDPTCCCAEQVDTGMAVRVAFASNNDDDDASNSSFLHYFAEAELLKVENDAVDNEKSTLPFDGMSCTAFKLDQLKVGSKPRRIASFDPTQSNE